MQQGRSSGAHSLMHPLITRPLSSQANGWWRADWAERKNEQQIQGPMPFSSPCLCLNRFDHNSKQLLTHRLLSASQQSRSSHFIHCTTLLIVSHIYTTRLLLHPSILNQSSSSSIPHHCFIHHASQPPPPPCWPRRRRMPEHTCNCW